MSRLTIEQAESRSAQASNMKYINQFYLTDDKDKTIVKVLLDDIKDLEVHSVHRIKMRSKSGKDYALMVDCLGDDCPMCHESQEHKGEKFPLVSRVTDYIFIPIIRLYNNDMEYDPVYNIWVRSVAFYRNTLAPYVARYGFDSPIEIERNGRRGDTKVSYNLFVAQKDYDNKAFKLPSNDQFKEDFEVKDDDIFGRQDSLIRSWTEEQFNEFLNTGDYPSNNTSTADETEEKPVARRRTSNHNF